MAVAAHRGNNEEGSVDVQGAFQSNGWSASFRLLVPGGTGFIAVCDHVSCSKVLVEAVDSESR